MSRSPISDAGPIAREHDLFMPGEERVERYERILPATFLAREIEYRRYKAGLAWRVSLRI